MMRTITVACLLIIASAGDAGKHLRGVADRDPEDKVEHPLDHGSEHESEHGSISDIHGSDHGSSVDGLPDIKVYDDRKPADKVEAIKALQGYKELSTDDVSLLNGGLQGVVTAIGRCADNCDASARGALFASGMSLAGTSLMISNSFAPAGTFLWMVGSLLSDIFDSGSEAKSSRMTPAAMIEAFRTVVRSQLHLNDAVNARLNLRTSVFTVLNDIDTLNKVIHVPSQYKWKNVNPGLQADDANLKTVVADMSHLWADCGSLLVSTRQLTTMKQDCVNQCPHNGNIKWSETCTDDRSVFITHVKEVSKDLALIGHAFNTLGFYVATLNFVFQKFGEENQSRGEGPRDGVQRRALHPWSTVTSPAPH